MHPETLSIYPGFVWLQIRYTSTKLSMNLTRIYLMLCFTLLLSLTCTPSRAQTPVERSYYTIFPKTILFRVFVSDKYTVLRVKNGSKTLRYVPNAPAAIGIGLSYRDLSLNFAYGVRMAGYNDKVKTTRIDLQSHLYSRKWLYDLYAQQYKGYYLPAGNDLPGNNYYARPDIKTLSLGFSLYRVFNSTRFSYRAAFVQTERQKISAGTFLLGTDLYYGRIKADSSIIPATLKDDYSPQQLTAAQFISMAPGAGYAYTLVITKKFFITASSTINFNVNYATELYNGNDRWHLSLTPTINFRTAAGYSGDQWNISANWISNTKPFITGNNSNRYILGTGNYRLIIARRFNTGKKLQKRLAFLDRIINTITPKRSPATGNRQ